MSAAPILELPRPVRAVSLVPPTRPRYPCGCLVDGIPKPGEVIWKFYPSGYCAAAIADEKTAAEVVARGYVTVDGFRARVKLSEPPCPHWIRFFFEEPHRKPTAAEKNQAARTLRERGYRFTYNRDHTTSHLFDFWVDFPDRQVGVRADSVNAGRFDWEPQP